MVKMSVKKTSFKLKERRYFSEAFKREKVNEILSKKITPKELSVLYEIKISVIYSWLHKYSKVKLSGVKIHYEMETEEQRLFFTKTRLPNWNGSLGKNKLKLIFSTSSLKLPLQS